MTRRSRLAAARGRRVPLAVGAVASWLCWVGLTVTAAPTWLCAVALFAAFGCTWCHGRDTGYLDGHADFHYDPLGGPDA